jgi:hypothetical protein
LLVFAVVDHRSSLDHPLGDAIETFIRRDDAERFIEEVRGDDPQLASYLLIEERSGPFRERFQTGRVPTSTTFVEVRGGRADGNESDVDVSPRRSPARRSGAVARNHRSKRLHGRIVP